MFDTYFGTTDGVYRLRDGAVEMLGLASERIWAIYAWRDGDALTILADSYGNGMHRSEDGGRTWSPANAGLTAAAFRCIGPDPLNPGAILADTEPGRVFRSADGGRTWQELTGITNIAGYEQWFLPYSPRAGAIRNVYAPPGGTGRLFASVRGRWPAAERRQRRNVGVRASNRGRRYPLHHRTSARTRPALRRARLCGAPTPPAR